MLGAYQTTSITTTTIVFFTNFNHSLLANGILDNKNFFSLLDNPTANDTITTMSIETTISIDVYVEKKDYKSCGYRIAKTEIEIYKVREAADHLLEEIKD